MIIIHSVLPNPVGPDTGNEWIKLANRGAETINLKDWALKDASGKTFVLSGTLPPQGEFTLKNSQTKIILNNGTDTVSLYDQSGKLVNSLSYENPAEGEVVMATSVSESPQTSAKVITPVADNYSGVLPSSSADFSPLLLGLLFALVMGVIAGDVAKYFGATNGANKF